MKNEPITTLEERIMLAAEQLQQAQTDDAIARWLEKVYELELELDARDDRCICRACPGDD